MPTVSNPQGGFGAIMKITVFSSLTAVASIIDFEWPEFEKVIAEITAHDSPSGYAEHLSTGKRMMNSFTMTLLWDRDHDTHHAMVQAFESDLAVVCSVEDKDQTEIIQFSAIVTRLGRMSDQEEGYQAEVEFQPTGAPSITYTSE